MSNLSYIALPVGVYPPANTKPLKTYPLSSKPMKGGPPPKERKPQGWPKKTTAAILIAIAHRMAIAIRMAETDRTPPNVRPGVRQGLTK